MLALLMDIKSARGATMRRTRSSSAGDRVYARTHRFYVAEGVMPLEVPYTDKS